MPEGLFTEPLFIFEMANNHMGSLEHGLRIVHEFAQVSRHFPWRFGFKLQYRDLDTFIHPLYRGRDDIKYVKRFSETRLTREQLRRLKDEIAAQGFVTICTPFDEPSVDLIEEHGFDVIKIGSCSFTDWPLLERIVRTEKPIIASTAGSSLDEIDKVVSFFEHRDKDFALMHCVGAYPTPAEELQLNQIDLLRARYPQVPVGFSTHEDPENTDAVKLAIAKGALILEKHVGVPTAEFPLNAYSATPAQARRWLEAAQTAFTLCGIMGRRAEPSEAEMASLRALRRGAFARRPLTAGERIELDDLFLAIPTIPGQVTANDLSKYTEFYATASIAAMEPLHAANTRRKETREQVYRIVQRVKELLRQSNVVVPPHVDLEISHHYGLDRFDEYGLTMITVVNRQYCKKLMILLPGQQHPEQYHNLKEETFHVLYGDVWTVLDGVRRRHLPGEIIIVERGVRHSFGSDSGAVVEEISSTHYTNDSFYTDPTVMNNPHRKTLLTYWLE